jgi:SRSO17 transposase
MSKRSCTGSGHASKHEQHLDNLRRKDSLRGAETTEVSVRLGSYSASHFEGSAFDPSSFPKRGIHSVGVKRQWCSHRGKVDNCQVGVYMGYVSRHDHALLDFRLSLPQDWARDEQRRRACHVPEEVQYHTRQEQCLEMLDLWGEQVPHGWVTGDDELGRHTRFRQDLRVRGERYVLGVPSNTVMCDLEASLPTYRGRGRRPKAPWQSVIAWRQSRHIPPNLVVRSFRRALIPWCSSANTLRIQRLKFGREQLTKGPDVIRHACCQRWCALLPPGTNRPVACARMQRQRLSQAHMRARDIIEGLEEDHALP